jgi:tRNA A58 N-methylase Trm61
VNERSWEAGRPGCWEALKIGFMRIRSWEVKRKRLKVKKKKMRKLEVAKVRRGMVEWMIRLN